MKPLEFVSNVQNQVVEEFVSNVPNQVVEESDGAFGSCVEYVECLETSR